MKGSQMTNRGDKISILEIAQELESVAMDVACMVVKLKELKSKKVDKVLEQYEFIHSECWCVVHRLDELSEVPYEDR